MAGVNVSKSYKKWIDLKSAVQDGSIKHVKKLLRQKVRVNLKDENGWSLLLYAIATESDGTSVNRCDEIIELLLKKGIEIDAQDEYGWTALMIASLKGYFETVKLLLKHKASVNAQNIDGWSSLMFACMNRKNKTAQVLLDHKANVNEQSENGLSALMIASRKGYTETVKLLLYHKARVNDQDKVGWCALMFASQKGYTEIVKLLLGVRGRYTTVTMIQNGSRNAENFSMEHYRIDINMQNNSGCTSLMIACETRQTEIVKCLLFYGADVTIKDKCGQSAINYALKNRHIELANLLMYSSEYDHLPSSEMIQSSTQLYDSECATVSQTPRQKSIFNASNATATCTVLTKPSAEIDRSGSFQQYRHHSEYDHLPCKEMSLTSIQNIEYNIIHRSGQKETAFDTPNTTAPSYQSVRHNKKADQQFKCGSFGTDSKDITSYGTGAHSSSRHHGPHMSNMPYRFLQNSSGNVSGSCTMKGVLFPSTYGYHSSPQSRRHTSSYTQRTMLPSSNKTGSYYADSLTKSSSTSRFTQDSGFYESSSHSSGFVCSLTHIVTPQSDEYTISDSKTKKPRQLSTENSFSQKLVFPTQNGEFIHGLLQASSV